MNIQDERLKLYLNVVVGKEDFRKLYTKNGKYVKSDCGMYSWKTSKHRYWVKEISKVCKKNKYTEILYGRHFVTITKKGLEKLEEQT